MNVEEEHAAWKVVTRFMKRFHDGPWQGPLVDVDQLMSLILTCNVPPPAMARKTHKKHQQEDEHEQVDINPRPKKLNLYQRRQLARYNK